MKQDIGFVFLPFLPSPRTVLDNGLSRISWSMSFFQNTLTSLCISSQRLSRIENIGNLPQLEELYLYENAIERIEGLEGCPRLKKLWLYSNQLVSLEGLRHLGHLRELWVQDNKLTDINELEYLVNLVSVNLSMNEIRDFKALEVLSRLPALQEVSFNDPHFGPCPIALVEEYLDFVMMYLKNLTSIDGRRIAKQDREEVQDAYLQSILRFNDDIDAIKKETSTSLQKIDSKINMYREEAREFSNRLGQSLNSLRHVIEDGRKTLFGEMDRLDRIREANYKALEMALVRIEQQYEEEVEKLMREEKEKIRMEEMFYPTICSNIDRLKSEAEIIITAVQRTNTNVLGVNVTENSPEHVYALSCYQRLSASSSYKATASSYRVFKILKVNNTEAHRAFAALEDTGAVSVHRVFAVAPPLYHFQHFVDEGVSKPPQAHDLLEGGSEALNPGPFHMNFFVDPFAAIAHWRGEPLESRDVEWVKQNANCPTLFLCRIALPEADTINMDMRPCGVTADVRVDPSEAGSFQGVELALSENQCVLDYALQLIPTRGLFPPLQDESLLQDYLMQVAFKGTWQETGLNPEEHLSEKLKELEKQVEEEYWAFQIQMWNEMDPTTAHKLRGFEQEQVRLRAELEDLEAKIANERQSQESIIIQSKMMRARPQAEQKKPRRTINPDAAMEELFRVVQRAGEKGVSLPRIGSLNLGGGSASGPPGSGRRGSGSGGRNRQASNGPREPSSSRGPGRSRRTAGGSGRQRSSSTATNGGTSASLGSMPNSLWRRTGD